MSLDGDKISNSIFVVRLLTTLICSFDDFPQWLFFRGNVNEILIKLQRSSLETEKFLFVTLVTNDVNEVVSCHRNQTSFKKNLSRIVTQLHELPAATFAVSKADCSRKT